ncbi:MAG: alpha/beta hydrolase [Bacteroidota bacterium]
MSKLVKTYLAILLASISFVVQANAITELKTEVSGKGQPIVFIPGLTCSGDVWDETVEQLKKNYECHVLTLPGFAGNAPLADHEGKYLEKMTNMVVSYIESNKLEKPIIVGHSLGGFLALNIAVTNPDLPSKLVIVDGLPFMTAIQMPGISAEQATGFAQNVKNQMLAAAKQPEEKRMTSQKMMLKSMIIDEEQIHQAAQWSVASDPETVGQAMYELFTTDIREDLANIKVPTLVLGAWIAYQDYGATREGTLDRYTQQFTKLDGAIVDMTDKGKHFIMWDDPEYFYGWLEKFL